MELMKFSLSVDTAALLLSGLAEEPTTSVTLAIGVQEHSGTKKTPQSSPNVLVKRIVH